MKKLAVIFVFLTLFLTTANAQDKKEAFNKIVEKEVKGDFVNVVMKVYNQTLSYQYPKVWNLAPAYRVQKGGYYMVEHLPKEQTLENWKEMLTYQGYKNLAQKEGVTSIKMISSMKERIKKVSEEELYFKPLYNWKLNGYDAAMALIGLKKLPSNMGKSFPEGQGELGLYLVIKGKKDVYVIQKSWRSEAFTEKHLPISMDELDKWIKVLAKTKLI